MANYTNYTNKEMQAVAIAQQIKNDQIVIVGTGLPLIGASLAKRVFAPTCHPIVESGLMDCAPIEVPRSVGDDRFMAHCAVQWPNIRFIEGTDRAYISQILAYSPDAAHDDAPDSAACLLRALDREGA